MTTAHFHKAVKQKILLTNFFFAKQTLSAAPATTINGTFDWLPAKQNYSVLRLASFSIVLAYF